MGCDILVIMRFEIIGLLVYCDGLRDSDWFQGLPWIQKYAGKFNGLPSSHFSPHEEKSGLPFKPARRKNSVQVELWKSRHST